MASAAIRRLELSPFLVAAVFEDLPALTPIADAADDFERPSGTGFMETMDRLTVAIEYS